MPPKVKSSSSSSIGRGKPDGGRAAPRAESAGSTRSRPKSKPSSKDSKSRSGAAPGATAAAAGAASAAAASHGHPRPRQVPALRSEAAAAANPKMKPAARKPRAAFVQHRRLAESLPPGTSVASAGAAAAGACMTPAVMARVSKLVGAKCKLQEKQAQRRKQKRAPTAQDDGGADDAAEAGMTQKEAREVLVRAMKQHRARFLELAPGHVAKLESKRGTGAVHDSVYDKLDEVCASVDTVLQAVPAVLRAVEEEVEAATQRRRPTKAQAAAAAALEADEDVGFATVAGDASTVAASVLTAVEDAAADAVRKARAKLSCKTPRASDAASVVSSVSQTPSALSASLAALQADKRTRASLVTMQRNGQLDVAAAAAEAVYYTVNPLKPCVGVVKQPPKADRDSISRIPLDGKSADAARVLVEARTRAAATAAQRRALKLAAEAAGDTSDSDDEEAGSAAGFAAKAAASSSSGAAGSAPTPAPAPAGKGATGEAQAKSAVESLDEEVADLLLAQVPEGAPARVTFKAKTAGSSTVTPVTLEAIRVKRTMEMYTWTRFTHALREAFASAMRAHTDIDPDLPCAQLLHKNPNAMRDALTPAVMREVVSAMRASAAVFKAAHTVTHSATKLKRAAAPRGSAATASRAPTRGTKRARGADTSQLGVTSGFVGKRAARTPPA